MAVSSLFNLVRGAHESIPPERNQLMVQMKKAIVLTKMTSFALQQFSEKKIASNFDPLVGETACHLRAIKCLVIMAHAEMLKEEVSKVRELSEQLFLRLTFKVEKNNVKAPKQTLLDVCEEDLVMSGDLKFLVESCFLSKFIKTLPDKACLFDYKEKSDTKLLYSFLTDDLHIQRSCLPPRKSGKRKYNGLDDLIKLTQSDLSHISVRFIKAMSVLSGEMTQNMLLNETYMRTDSYNRNCVACFYAFDVLISTVRKTNQRLLVEVHLGSSNQTPVSKVQMLFGPNESGTDFQPIDLPQEGPAIIISGYAIDEQLTCKEQYLNRFKSSSLSEMLLAFAALHPQYPRTVDQTLPDDPRREAFAKMAKEKGFCMENPSFFVINHFYCAMLEEVISKDAYQS
ncbi:MAG: hypothetical protein K1000chlam4_00008 [Chlamydiae bacterium]|nr:hypothetical protein [Chlamydiota bacterium]